MATLDGRVRGLMLRWSKRTRVDGRVATVFVVLCTCVTGCTNNPNALQMTLHPRKPVFTADEPIELDAKLVAQAGPVCIAGSHWFNVDMAPVSKDKGLLRGTEQGLLRLDTLATFYPWLGVVPMLDVADLSGRFKVLYQGHTLAARLKITHGGAKVMLCSSPRVVPVHAGPRWGVPPKREILWPPGEYEVTVSLDNRHLGLCPPPFFWKPYDQPVSAKTRITVRE